MPRKKKVSKKATGNVQARPTAAKAADKETAIVAAPVEAQAPDPVTPAPAPSDPAEMMAKAMELAAEKMAAAMLAAQKPSADDVNRAINTSRVDKQELANAFLEALDGGPREFYISGNRHLKQWGEDVPELINAAPNHVVKVTLPAKMVLANHRTGKVEIVDQLEDDTLHYEHPGVPVEAARPGRRPATPTVPGGPVA